MLWAKVSAICTNCGDRTIHIYRELLMGDRDEYTVFRETFERFFLVGYEIQLVILAGA